MAVELGLTKRQVVQMPPRHGKTTSCAYVLPFHYFTMFPWREVVYVTHDASLAAERGELLRDLINDMGPAFGIRVSPDSKAKDDFDITDLDGRKTGGSMRCFGVGAGIHGFGADLLILDDLFGGVDDVLSAAKRDAVWRKYTSSLHTRLSPGAAVVSIGTPLHEDDWFGRAKKAEDEGGEKWDRLRMPALAEDEDDPLGRDEGEPLWPESGWTAGELEAKRDMLVSSGLVRDWSAQYRLRPISGDGATEWDERYFEGVLDPWEYAWGDGGPWASVMAVDTSKGKRALRRGDWQALVMVEPDAKGHVRVRSHLCRVDVKGLRKTVIEHAKNLWQPQTVVVETNGAGYALLEDLWEAGIPALGREHGSEENKLVRITQRLGRSFEAGVLHFDPTPSNRLLVGQAREFPHGKYDDGIDALEMALEYVAELRKLKHLRRVRYTRRAA